MTLNTSLSAVIYLLALVHLCTVNSQHTTFEVPSFTDSKNMIGAKFKKTGHLTLTTSIRMYFVTPRLALDISYDACIQNLATLASAVLEITLGAQN